MHAAFVWSRYAHAHIEGIDSSAALELDGIVAIYTAEDLSDYWKPGPLLDSPPPIKDIVFNELTQVPLAKDKIRFVGEPVALVLAESRYIADDAIDRVWVDYDPIPVVVDLELALEDGTAFVHEDFGSNVAAHVIEKRAIMMRFGTRRILFSVGVSYTIEEPRPLWRIVASSLSGIPLLSD